MKDFCVRVFIFVANTLINTSLKEDLCDSLVQGFCS